MDAVLSAVPEPGRIRRVDLHAVLDRDCGLSTHSIGIGDVLRLGAVLGRCPRRLVVLTVATADLGVGPGLSPRVAAAVPALVQASRDELARAASGPGSA